MSLAIQANVETITNTLQNFPLTVASGLPNDWFFFFCKIAVQRSKYFLQLGSLRSDGDGDVFENRAEK